MTAPVRIEHCGRTVASSVVAFDIRWAGELPEEAVVSWVVRVTSEDSGSRLELGHRRDRGRPEQYARDVTTGRVEDDEPDADLEEGGITVRFPLDVVGVAVEWPTWQAVITVDGEDVSSRTVTV